MNEAMKEILAMVIAGIIVLLIILTLIFSMAPLEHFAGGWWDYWNSPEKKATTTLVFYPYDYSSERQANAECSKRAVIYFNSPSVLYEATSTDNYAHYKCLGIKLKEIPLK